MINYILLAGSILILIALWIFVTVDISYYYENRLPAQIRRKILKDQCRTQIYVQRYLEGYTR